MAFAKPEILDPRREQAQRNNKEARSRSEQCSETKKTPIRGSSRKEANTRCKEVAFQRVLAYNELIDKLNLKQEVAKMDYIKMLREDMDLSDLLCEVCDIEVLPEFKIPEDEFGHLTYNIAGKTFARAGSGSEYILLEDGSIGFWGSEGKCGRIADNLKEFFEFMVNCPYWLDYLDEEEYCNRERLGEYAKEIFEEHIENAEDMEFNLAEAQQKLANRLGVEKKTDVIDILMRFYQCTKREPRFISTYRENDSSIHSGTGSLFER